MHCTECGAKLLEEANFCVECGTRIPHGKEEPAAAGPVSEERTDAAKGFLDSISARMESGTLRDKSGKPLEPLSDDELQAITSFVLQMARQGGAESGLRCCLDLGQDSRKTVVALLGLLPLVGADAQARGMPVLYVTPDSGSLSEARNAFRAYMILSQNVEFMTWDDLERVLAGGHRAKDIWVLGDLDWKSRPIENADTLRAIRRAAGAIASNPLSCAVFMHQAGHEPVIEPPKLEEALPA